MICAQKHARIMNISQPGWEWYNYIILLYIKLLFIVTICDVAFGSFAYIFKCQQNPWGLAFDPQGRLHVASYSSNCIQVFSPEGTSLTSYGTGTLNKPSGIAIDAEGYIAVSEYHNLSTSCDYSRLWVFAADQSLVHTVRCFKY